MANCDRRQFLRWIALAAATPGVPASLFPQAGMREQYDLVIAGGRVIDPAQNLDTIADLGIADGKIVRVASGLAKEQARRVFDAKGQIVTPGLIDMHGHVYDDGIPTSIDPDVVGIPRGVTTIVDAGSAGASTFAGFRRYVIQRAQTRVCALLNISSIGLVVLDEIYIDPKLVNPKAAVQTIRANPNLILGIKVRIRGRDDEVDHDMEVLKKAREAADETGLPIMLHWTNEPRLLSLLKRGDVLAHPFNPPQAGPSLLGADGKVLPQILELNTRGIFTDFAHGSHLQWETAEKAAQQGWFPDTISTDIHRAHVGPNGTVIDLVTTMSKFIYLGLPLSEVIRRVTVNPTRVLRFPEAIGNLESGNVADISILRIEDRDVEFLDSVRHKRTGHSRIVPVATLRAGKLIVANG